VRDGIELAKLDIPSVILIPRGLVPLATDKAKYLGLPDLPLAILETSLYTLSHEQIADEAYTLREDILAALVAAA
jgi:hypothetical protein